ncbi:hypothetical protein Y032_0637g959 [Ancylostoma ceylanicum]|uniref:Uncharacterized protein n=1 Tax=Ancylostoma ceylanicum TaxID=53326 RepID=A0A016WJ90_9BILA|nr:hypothetical protein Y032_0637g959 [Ancylostoma ceylanicum]
MYETLRQMWPAAVNRGGPVLLQDNSRPHSSKLTRQKLTQLGIDSDKPSLGARIEGSARSEPSVASPGAEGNSTFSETQKYEAASEGLRQSVSPSKCVKSKGRFCALASISGVGGHSEDFCKGGHIPPEHFEGGSLSFKDMSFLSRLVITRY